MTVLLATLFLPLIGAILNGLLIRSKHPRRTGVIATLFALGSFISSIWLTASIALNNESISTSIDWFSLGNVAFRWGLAFDPLTAVMCLIVTGIGSTIHLYSIGYMHDDKTPYRFFSYLNLFLFFMLVLVTGSNLVVLFVGWEGVGLCSYLLIGYYYQNRSYAAAGMKAFVVNRIGDAGFIVGILLTIATFHCVDFFTIQSLLESSRSFDVGLLNIIAFCFLIGAIGKSAQIPLFVWLPDAMAGPTPVSALIHAATMVTAGIYLIVRMSFLFQITADTNTVMAIIGGGTALLGALIATSQSDIKKILAYSTVSQLGLMFLGLSAGAYVASLFHVLTHAFFKALLFLGAGSIIHALSGTQDISLMGGLKNQLKTTHLTFLIGVVAIAGIPPFSGFFSKDMILFTVLEHNGVFFWGLGLVVSWLTAFYMMRLYCLVFLGTPRFSENCHPHESPTVMVLPLMLLAMGSVVSGWIEIPGHGAWIPKHLSNFLQSVIVHQPHGISIVSETTAMLIATLVAVSAIAVSLSYYRRPFQIVPALLRGPYTICKNKFWVDELYTIVLVRPVEYISLLFAKWVDPLIIDGFFLIPARLSMFSANVLSMIQTGSISLYLFVMVAGSLFVLYYYVRGII